MNEKKEYITSDLTFTSTTSTILRIISSKLIIDNSPKNFLIVKTAFAAGLSMYDLLGQEIITKLEIDSFLINNEELKETSSFSIPRTVLVKEAILDDYKTMILYSYILTHSKIETHDAIKKLWTDSQSKEYNEGLKQLNLIIDLGARYILKNYSKENRFIENVQPIMVSDKRHEIELATATQKNSTKMTVSDLEQIVRNKEKSIRELRHKIETMKRIGI